MTEQMNGLSSEQVNELLSKYGRNELTSKKKESFLLKALHTICEPMFLLLIAAATIYFFLGEMRDGAIMLIFVVGIITIDIIQEWKTDKTLAALGALTAPQATVLRDGELIKVDSALIVPGDMVLVSEGDRVPADGKVVRSSDLCVDESSLTGESEGVWKTVSTGETPTDYWRKDYCYASTVVTQGSGYILIDKTGAYTEYGKIGKNVAGAPEVKTPLQKQTDSLVKTAAGVAAVLFALVGLITYFNLPQLLVADRITSSILSGITLAMAMIPEEFPVILTVFLSLGAWRIAKSNALVRRLPSVETLGAVSVLCVDKTGTITENCMSVREVWTCFKDEAHLDELMGLGCETDTYDPMERAMLDYCEQNGITRQHLFGGRLITEYPFTNELKMMGHVWEHDEELVIAAKGSAERILTISDIGGEQKDIALAKINEMSAKGLRVIAIGETHLKSEIEIPADIHACRLTLCGLVGLADPPREGMEKNIAICKKAGVRVVMITGDNGITAASIAKQIGMDVKAAPITGDMIDNMTDEELCVAVRDANIFSRVIPEHKMRIVKAFQSGGHIVAMTGDGVNDAPALKHADIGIAMGGRGSEVSREAADIILTDDNFATIVSTIRDGRRIYDNIRRAVGYVFTIHIPIAFTSLIAPLLGIAPANLMLLPLHVVLLELLIDPTCSIVLERQPAERNIMERPPRDTNEKLLTARTLTKSVIQGVVLFAASFGLYLAFNPFAAESAPTARAAGLAVIMISNLLLVQVNSSNRDSLLHSAVKLLKDPVMWAVNIGTLAMLAVILYTPISKGLSLAPLSAGQMLICIGVAAASVLWYEIVKLFKRLKEKKQN